MSVIIKIDTGYVGACHECDTGLTREEWSSMTEKQQHDWIETEVQNHISAYAVDEDDPETTI